MLVFDMFEFDKLLIGWINGDVFGLGVMLVLCCDIMVMCDIVWIGDIYVCMGFVVGDGGVLFWLVLVGLMVVWCWLLLGDLFDGREVVEVGLVMFLVLEDYFDVLVEKWVGKLLNGVIYVIVGIKCVFNMVVC